MQVYLKQVKGITMAAKGNSNHWVMMDSEEAFGGSKAAATPMEMVLIALGGCTSMDVISITNKMRVNLDCFEVIISADRATEHPKVFTNIQIDYYFFGDNIKEVDIKRAVDLSQEKYCSVSAMLKSSVQLTYAYHINQALPATM